MQSNGFPRTRLLREATEARERAMSLLAASVARIGDHSIQTIHPGPLAFEEECNAQEAVWLEEGRLLKWNLLFWTGVLAVLAATIAVSVVMVLVTSMTVGKLVAAAFAALALLALVRIVPLGISEFTELKKWRSRGCSSVALGVMANIGRSAWILGTRGLHVAHNDRTSGGATTSFHPFETLYPPRASIGGDAIVIELFNRDGGLVRVLVYPGSMKDQAENAIRLVCRAICSDGSKPETRSSNATLDSTAGSL